jgi:hypothetical protein
MPAAILHNLGINRVRLLTNNPRKSRALSDAGILVLAEIPCEAAPTPHSFAYLRTKKEKMGHTLSFGGEKRAPFSPRQGRGEGETGAADELSPTNHSGATSEDQFEFASIEVAIRELRAGRMIVVIDDEDRENEGDLTMAADMITPEAINFMATHGRGPASAGADRQAAR